MFTVNAYDFLKFLFLKQTVFTVYIEIYTTPLLKDFFSFQIKFEMKKKISESVGWLGINRKKYLYLSKQDDLASSRIIKLLLLFNVFMIIEPFFHCCVIESNKIKTSKLICF